MIIISVMRQFSVEFAVDNSNVFIEVVLHFVIVKVVSKYDIVNSVLFRILTCNVLKLEDDALTNPRPKV